MNSFFACFSVSVVIGVDFGHANIKTGMGKFSGVVAVNNDQAKKLSPSYFAIWNNTDQKNSKPSNGKHWTIEELEGCNWDYTARAQSHFRRNPSNSIKSFFPLLSESAGVSHREAMASTLRYLIRTVDTGVFTPEKTMLALSVEPFLSRQERYALKEVAQLANTTLTYIVDSPTAVANYYALGRKTKGTSTIGFVDIGATGMWFSIYSFVSMGRDVIMNQKVIKSTNKIGGDEIDKMVGNYLYNKFVEQTGQRDDSVKTLNKFYETAKIAKERLSLGIDYNVNMEDVIGEYGLKYLLKCDEFDTLIEPLTESLTNIINEAMKEANFEKLDAVEIIGGSSRVNKFQEVIKELTKVESISRTMNAEEAVILGATILASTKSSSYRLQKKVKASTFCNTILELELNNNKTLLFNKTDKMEKQKMVVYKVSDIKDKNFTLFSDNDYKKPMDIFTIEVPENSTDDEEVVIKFGFDEFSLPNITKVEVNGSKANITHYFSDWQLNEERFAESQKFVMELERIEQERKNASLARNEYELYVYEIQQKIEDDEEFKEFLTDEDIESIKKSIEEHKNWLENLTNPFEPTKTFTDKMDNFKQCTNAVENRIKEWIDIPKELEELNKTLKEVWKYIDQEVPRKRPWMWTAHKSNMDNLMSNYEENKKWFDENSLNLTSRNKTENPSTSSNQIRIKHQILGFNLKGSKRQRKPSSTPVPTPTPEGYKPETESEPKEKGSDESSEPFELPTGSDATEKLRELVKEHRKRFNIRKQRKEEKQNKEMKRRDEWRKRRDRAMERGDHESWKTFHLSDSDLDISEKSDEPRVDKNNKNEEFDVFRETPPPEPENDEQTEL